MRSTVSLLFGVIFLILPGVFIASVGGTSLVLIFGVLEIAFALGSIVYAIKPGRKNPLKFLAFLPVILLIVFSKGYAARYIPIAIGMPPADLSFLIDTVFLAEFGLIGMMSFETANSLTEVLKRDGYDEDEWRREIGRLNNFSLGIGLGAVVFSYLIYLFITSVPVLKINPLFALLIFGVIYFAITRFFSRSRKSTD